MPYYWQSVLPNAPTVEFSLFLSDFTVYNNNIKIQNITES